MNRTRVIFNPLLIVMTLTTACAPINHIHETFISTNQSSFFPPTTKDEVDSYRLQWEADQLLSNCDASQACSRAHFIKGLLALYDSRTDATEHFQAVIAEAPASTQASSSLFWLQLLDAPPPLNPRLAQATVRFARDLLDRERLFQTMVKELGGVSAEDLKLELKVKDKKIEELSKALSASSASAVTSLQKELKDREKKLDELANQIEALKNVDREMLEKARITRPPRNLIPSPETDTPKGAP